MIFWKHCLMNITYQGAFQYNAAPVGDEEV